MRQVQVNLPGREYTILIGSGLARLPGAKAWNALVAGRRCLLVADSHVEKLYGPAFQEILAAAGAAAVTTAVFPAGEESKTLATFGELCREAARAGLDRKGLAVAVGGGVTGDLTGFLAASWMRGIDFIQVPTTLLAMVDSSVGGKTGVDLPEGKNLVGAFHQPRLVWCELDTLKTLPDREWRCGLAEIVKYGVILDAPLFARLEGHTLATLQAEPETVAEIVARCCEIKAQIVLADERETTGLRAVLNYGHTFGHALETCSGYGRFNHGEAVAIGMGMAADLAAVLGRCPAELPARQDALLRQLGLPVCAETTAEVTPETILELMFRDKKTAGGKLRLILPREIGTVEIMSVEDRGALLRAIGGRTHGNTGESRGADRP